MNGVGRAGVAGCQGAGATVTQEDSKSTVADKYEKDVKFGNVVLHSFPVTIGDNPSCSHGCPVALGSITEGTTVTRLETYENRRPPRRSGRELMIDKKTREYM